MRRTRVRSVTCGLSSPAQDSAQQGGVEALRWGEASLHLADRHLVFGGGAEQRQATGHRTEHLGRVGHGSHAEALLADGQGREGRAVEFGRDGNWTHTHTQRTFRPFALMCWVKGGEL